MLALCLKCYKIYRPNVYSVDGEYVKYASCPDMSCQHELKLIDENMLQIIITLNKKGYKTTDCCASHIWENYDGLYDSLYIVFDDDIQPATVPKGFYTEMQHHEDWLDPKIYGDNPPQEIKDKAVHFKTSLRKRYEDIMGDAAGMEPTPLDIQKYIFKQLNILLEWAQSLPQWDYNPQYQRRKEDKSCYFCGEPTDARARSYSWVENGIVKESLVHDRCLVKEFKKDSTDMDIMLKVLGVKDPEMGEIDS